jgi:hypothetical protein
MMAQGDSVEMVYAATKTEMGRPAGKKISDKIGREGGKLASADGRLELVVPEGALDSRTSLSIQPINNTLSPGKADAYDLEPSGRNFEKPLQLIFHYSKTETVGVMPALKGIAWQDDKGQWFRLDNTVVDTIGHTVTGSITHFSHWAYFDAFTLVPEVARLKVNHQLPLKIICTGVPSPSGPVLTDETIESQVRFTTYADGIRGGNNVVGTVSAVRSQSAKYKAPASVPNGNPVAVSVETNAGFTLNGQHYNRLKLVSRITIIDNSYEIKVLGYNEQHTLQCTISSIDSATCILQLDGGNSKLQDIQNINAKVTINSCPCDIKEINAGGNLGPVNIVGAARIDVVPANPPAKPYANVTVYFIRNMGVIPGMSVGPCGHNPPISGPPIPLQAVPFVLKFDAKEGEQSIMKGGDEKNGFEVRVTRIDEDH